METTTKACQRTWYKRPNGLSYGWSKGLLSFWKTFGKLKSQMLVALLCLGRRSFATRAGIIHTSSPPRGSELDLIWIWFSANCFGVQKLLSGFSNDVQWKASYGKVWTVLFLQLTPVHRYLWNVWLPFQNTKFGGGENLNESCHVI